MVRRACAVALVCCAFACSDPQPDDAPSVTFERSPTLLADLFTIESDTLVDGERPKLTLVCRNGMPANFQIDLLRPHSAPPVERVFAQMQVKGGPEVTVELQWLEGSKWAARMPDAARPESDAPDRNNQERVVPVLHAFSRERALTITPPPAHGPAQKLVWSPATFGEHLPAVQRCAALPEG